VNIWAVLGGCTHHVKVMRCLRKVRIQHDSLNLREGQDISPTLNLNIWVIYGLSTPEHKMSQTPT